jgi:prepilin-type N-terminal cleavage/methylation domain-containing protein
MSMNLRTRSKELLRDQHAYTMVELLVAMALGTLVATAAFSFLQFSTSDVTRINERARLNQTGRVALERVMLRLHSACVAPSVAPIQPESTATKIRFVSEAGTTPAFATVHLHEIVYSSANNTLVEKTYTSTGEGPKSTTKGQEYSFSTTVASTTTLLTGVKESESEGSKIPIFRYYRYYREGDKPPPEHTTVPYGELDPSELKLEELKTETPNIAKVAISFTLAPTGKESATFKRDRPVPLEDSVVFRLAPSSELSTTTNLPCSRET